MASKTTYITEIELGARTNSSYSRNLRYADSSLEALNRKMQKLESATTGLDKLDTAATKAGKTLLTVGAAAAAGIGVLVSTAEETYKSFEQEMANVSSIAKATQSEYSLLKASALDAGSKTVYTAEESAEALEKMSLAGWDVTTSTQALMPVLKMAAATNKDLGNTSDLVTDSMGALKLQVNDLSSYMDMLISANNNSNTSAEQLMQALIKTGGAARTVGADLPDTITALGILANNGTKAEEAGTAMNSMLTRMASNSTAIKTLNQIGVSIFDADGKFIGLKESLIEINDAMKLFTDEQKASTISGIAGTRRYSLMKYLLDAVNDDTKTGVSAWDKLEQEVRNSTGALDQMYATNTDTLKMAEAQLNSAKEDMQIRVTDVFADDQKEFIQWMAGEVPKATDAIVEFAEAHKGEFADALESAGEAIEQFAVGGMEAAAWAVENKTAVIGSLKGIAGGILTIKAAATGVKITESLSKLSMGPVGILTAITSAAVTAGFAIKGFVDNAEEQAAANNLAEHFGKISLSMKEIDELSRRIVGEESLAGVEEVLNATADAANSMETATSGWSNLQKESWKINVGFTMNTDDYQQYGSDLESYVQNVEKYAEDKGYQVHVATTLLFGSGSEMDIELSDSFTKAQAEIEKYGDQLHDYLYDDVNGALLDGIIDIDEDKVVQEYLDKINNIMQQMSDAKASAKFDSLNAKYSGKDLDTDTINSLQKDLEDNVNEVKEGAGSALEAEMEAINFRQARGEYTAQQAASAKAEAEKRYHDTISNAVQQSADYMGKTLEDAYPDLKSAIPDYEKAFDEIYKKYTDTSNEGNVEGWKYNSDIMIDNMNKELLSVMEGMMSGADRKAIEGYVEQMKPTIEMIREEVEYYNSIGAELPESLKEANDKWTALESIASGRYDEAADDIQSRIKNDNKFQKFIKDMGIQIDESYAHVEKKINDTYSQGYDIDTDLRVNININAKTTGYDKVQQAMDAAQSFISQQTSKKSNIDVNSKLYKIITGGSSDKTSNGIAQNAEGGIYDKPILTTFAEEGTEAAIPINKTQRARSLWLQTGQMMGMLEKTPQNSRDRRLLNSLSGESQKNSKKSQNTREVKLVYSPSIVIKGNASKQDIQQALRVSKEDIRRMMEEIEQENLRTAF